MTGNFSLADVPPYIGSAKYVVSIQASRLQAFVEGHADDGGHDLDPDFQRGHVWTDALRTAFVEHLLRGGEHGRTIVWNSPTYDALASDEPGDLPPTLVIVDGKQRYTAVTRFLAGGVTVFGERTIDDFDEASRRDMLSATGRLRMSMHVHALRWRRQLLDLYLQMNEGAVAHAPSEIERVRALRDLAPAPEDQTR